MLLKHDAAIGGITRGAKVHDQYMVAQKGASSERDLQVADSSLDGCTSSKDTVVLEDEGTVCITKGVSYIVTLFVGENDTAEVLIESTLAVEGAAVLGSDFDCSGAADGEVTEWH